MKWAKLVSAAAFATLILCIYTLNQVHKDGHIIDTLFQNVIRVCPLCTSSETPKSAERKALAMSQKLSSIDLDNDPATIQQLPYKISGDVDIPQSTGERQTYNPGVVIKFSQVNQNYAGFFFFRERADEWPFKSTSEPRGI
jgi:hypothetical protein